MNSDFVHHAQRRVAYSRSRARTSKPAFKFSSSSGRPSRGYIQTGGVGDTQNTAENGRNQFAGTRIDGNVNITSYERRESSLELADKYADLHECRESLWFPEINNRVDDVRNATSRTCTWLPQHESYLQWQRSNQGQLWILGHPGSGKSTLLRWLKKRIQPRELIETRPGEPYNENDVVLSFFFHDRGKNPLQKTMLGLLRTLLYQLGVFPDAVSRLVARFRSIEHPGGITGKEWEGKEVVLEEHLKLSLSRLLNTYNVWILVDALDESDRTHATQLTQLFDSLLTKLEQTSKLHICITCQHYPELVKPNQYPCILMEEHNEEDIGMLVRQEFSTSRNLEGAEIERLIVRRAQGIFIWAFMVARRAVEMNHQGKPQRAIENMIQETPEKLGELYTQLVVRAYENTKTIREKDEAKRHKARTLRLFQWICFAARPIPLDELRWALIIDAAKADKTYNDYRAMDDYIMSSDEMKSLLRPLSLGLAEVAPGRMSAQFIHQSVKDWFCDGGWRSLTDNAKQPYSNELKVIAHRQLAVTCYEYMKVAVCGIFQGQPSSRWATADRAFEDYAVTYFVFHVLQSQPNQVTSQDLNRLTTTSCSKLVRPIARTWGRADQLPMMTSFFEAHLVRWIESTSRFSHSANSSRFANNNELHDAVEDGNVDSVRHFLNKGAYINGRLKKKDDATPLILACRAGKESIVRLLLARNANMEISDRRGRAPLHVAVLNGWDIVTRLLLEHGANVKATDENGTAPLHIASWEGHEGVMQQLLKHGGNMEATDNDNWTPLHAASITGHEAVVQQLLKHGGNIEATDNNNWTPLHAASITGHEAVVQQLLKNGAKIEARDKNGQTPLMLATRFGYKLVLQQLLEGGADPSIKDRRGKTAELLTKRRSFQELLRKARQDAQATQKRSRF